MGGLFKYKTMLNYNSILDLKLEDTNTTEPISLEDMKLWLRLDIEDDDDLVTALIKTARVQIEGYLNRSLVLKNVKAILNNSLGSIYLPYCPIISAIEDIVIKDKSGNDITNAEILGLEFPYIALPAIDYIYVEYSTGYAQQPDWAIAAIKQQVSWLYENRGDETKIGQLSPMALATLKQYRL